MAENMLKARLTKRLIDSAAPRSDGELRIWDSALPGFMVRISPNGKKTYGLKFRLGKEQRWCKIGEHGMPWTPEMARDKAFQILAGARRGHDLSRVDDVWSLPGAAEAVMAQAMPGRWPPLPPAGRPGGRPRTVDGGDVPRPGPVVPSAPRHDHASPLGRPIAMEVEDIAPWDVAPAWDQAEWERDRAPAFAPVAPRRPAPTVSELFELYLTEGPQDKPLKRASSWDVDRSCYIRHVKPLLGDRVAEELRPHELAAFQAKVASGATSRDIKTKRQGVAKVRGGPGVAARAMRALSAMLNWAIWREILKENPARHVQKLRDVERERPLSLDEARAVWSAVEEAEKAWLITRDMADIIRLIMLTGARRNEIVELSWSEVDLDRSRLHLPPVRTKIGGLNRARIIALSEPARAILEKRAPKDGAAATWVFTSSRTDRPLAGINRAWEKVRAILNMEDVRLHDLRHSFATFAVEGGASLYVVGKSLGHRKSVSTERYAHVGDLPQRGVADLVAQRLFEGMEPSPAPTPKAEPARSPFDRPSPSPRPQAGAVTRSVEAWSANDPWLAPDAADIPDALRGAIPSRVGYGGFSIAGRRGGRQGPD